MRWDGFLLILLLFTASFAVPVIESGDGGEQFAQDTAEAKCLEENVQAVYHCLGNVVRVVSTIPGEGSMFYKPDGRVIHCPVVSPPEMGAECLQLMLPNYCPVQAECGSSPEQVFPGQNDTPEQTGDEDYYIIEGEAASEEPEEVEEEPVLMPKEDPPKPPKPVKNEETIPAVTENKVDSLLGDLSIMILLLGLVSIGVLFMLFKKSINE